MGRAQKEVRNQRQITFPPSSLCHLENCLDLVYEELINLVCPYQSVPHQYFFCKVEESGVVTISPADGKHDCFL